MRIFTTIFFALITALSIAKQRADSTLLDFIDKEGLAVYDAIDVSIYTDGTSTFDAIFADMDNAQERVWVEFMIVANDSIGQLMLTHMSQAAKRGCEVRLIIDDYKDWERNYGFRRKETQDSIKNLGIDFVLFDPFRFPWANHVFRCHRKIVVIDDNIGYIGGLNVADYYVNGNAKYGGWRDTHSRITGPAVEGLALLFDQQYRQSGGKGLYTFSAYHCDRIADPIHKITYFERGRANKKLKSQTRRAIIAAFDAATDTIRVVSPYFLPTHTVRQAIIRAIDRGVHVEILFSKVGDNPMLSYGNFNFAKRLVRHGAEVYLYKGAFHHSKILMVDGVFSMIGSANLNSRSLKWDYEASSFIFSKDITSKLNTIFEIDKENCDTFSVRYYKNQFPLSQRIGGWWIDRCLTPIL